MAFLDFLNTAVSGGALQGPTATGATLDTVARPMSPTWGDVLKTGASLSSSPSAKQIGGIVPGQNLLGNQMKPLQPSPSMATTPQEDQKKDSTGGLGAVVSLLGSLFGIPIGV